MRRNGSRSRALPDKAAARPQNAGVTTPQSAIASPHDEPTLAPPGRWILWLTLASLGVWAGFFGPIQVLLAQQAEAISPANKEFVFSLVTGLGAVVSVICNPVFGAFSDRTGWVRGRRLPWIAGGAVGGALSLLLLGQAQSVWMMAFAWCLCQATLNAMLAALTATVPDQVPVSQRGTVGGFLAVAQTIGIVGGVGIASVTGSIAAGYTATAIVLVVLTLPYCFESRDLAVAPGSVEPFQLRPFLASFWISPTEHPDFAWAWITRFLANLGNSLGTLYLFFYLRDVLGQTSTEAEGGVLMLTAAYAVALVATTVVFGRWSDRTGRRKVFVIWSGIVAGIAALLLGLGQSWTAALAAAVILGIGFGIYTSVDFALITQVLPSAEARAKDLGVINIANALPQVAAPLVATALIGVVRSFDGSVSTQGDSFSVGYAVVYGAAFLFSVAGSVLVTRIKSVA